MGAALLATAVVGVGMVGLGASTGRALNFAEPGDAGANLGGAAAAGTFNGTAGGLTSISGSIAGTDGLDADVYSFTLGSATALRLVSTSTAGLDTALFLFSSTGAALLANDDASGTSIQGALTTGTLAAGTYYLGISLSGNEPVNSANQLLFAGGPGTTGQRGAASGLNPATLAGFNGNVSFAEGGAYSIGLSAVPEPGTWALLGAGALVLGATTLRRKQTA